MGNETRCRCGVGIVGGVLGGRKSAAVRNAIVEHYLS